MPKEDFQNPFSPFIPSLDGCGACHQWGYNPPLKDGKCTICDRTQEDIIKDHGFLKLTTINHFAGWQDDQDD